MRRVLNALRIFFLTLFNRQVAQQVQELLERRSLPAPAAAAPKPAAPPKPVAPPPQKVGRSEAVTLLATLQREGRLIDFLKEPLAGYSDAQIGAAVRDVHRDCAAVLERLFGLKPLVDQAEGSPIELAAGFDVARYRLTGNVAGQPPYRGRVMHHGWEAARCQLPEWSGSAASALVVAPAEVEIAE